jgi:hypothetical protein
MSNCLVFGERDLTAGAIHQIDRLFLECALVHCRKYHPESVLVLTSWPGGCRLIGEIGGSPLVVTAWDRLLLNIANWVRYDTDTLWVGDLVAVAWFRGV